MSKGWLVNDILTCIPGTKTLWHDLLSWFPNLQDKTNGYTPYHILPNYIENELRNYTPDYIIRNASYFRPLNTNIFTISFLQDILYNSQQIEVCEKSNITVYNSPYIAHELNILNNNKINSVYIPIGIDFSFFKSSKSYADELGILDNSILFIGANTEIKGFDKILYLINNTEYNFTLVMKDDFIINHSRVKVFNKVNHDTLVKIINSCAFLICTSAVETQHLAGIEAAACNKPLLTTNVGAYYSLEEKGEWGMKITNLEENIKTMFLELDLFNSRSYFMSKGFDRESCKNNWINLLAKNVRL